MYILAIETTGPFASVAIAGERDILGSKKSEDKMNHLKTLTPMIDELVKELNIEMKDLTAIAVSTGPGSFTGIRIGVSTARALAQVLDIPCVEVDSLKAFAFSQLGYEAMICPVLDARRNQVYGGSYFSHGTTQIHEFVPAGCYDIDEYLDLVKEAYDAHRPFVRIDGDVEPYLSDIMFMGDGIGPFGDDISGWAIDNAINIEFQDKYQIAESVAILGLWEYKAGRTLNYSELEPNYMRKPEAQRNLEERLANKE